jgi:hypothetical protein
VNLTRFHGTFAPNFKRWRKGSEPFSGNKGSEPFICLLASGSPWFVLPIREKGHSVKKAATTGNYDFSRFNVPSTWMSLCGKAITTSIFLEHPRNLETQSAAHATRASLRGRLNPEKCVKNQGGVSKILENDRRRWFFENVWIISG